MRVLNEIETREINGGATYICPFCNNASGGYWQVYWHALYDRCFTRNATLNKLWKASNWCFNKAFTIQFGKVLKSLGFGTVGKHAK